MSNNPNTTQLNQPGTNSRSNSTNITLAAARHIQFGQNEDKLAQQAMKRNLYQKEKEIRRNQINQCAIIFHKITSLAKDKLKSPKALIGRLKMINKTSDNLENKFDLGTCFIANQNWVIATVHQLYSIFEEAKNQNQAAINIWISFPIFQFSSLSQKQKCVQVDKKNIFFCNRYLQNPTINNDYAFIEIKLTENQGRIIKDSLTMIKFGETKEFVQKNFKFDAIICGYIKQCPLQIIKDQDQINKYKNQLIQSRGEAFYNGNHLQYQAYTVNGMSGSPIFIYHKNVYIIIGMHIKGNSYKQKNYGLLFNEQIQQKLKQLKLNKESILDTLQIKQSFRQRCLQFENQQTKLQQIGNIMKSLINKLYQFEVKSIYVDHLDENNIYLIKSEDKKIKNNVFFDKLSLRYSYRHNLQDKGNFLCFKNFINNNEFIKGIMSDLASGSSEKKMNPYQQRSFLPYLIKYIENGDSMYFLVKIISILKKPVQASQTKKQSQAIQQSKEQKKIKKLLSFFKMQQYKLNEPFQNRISHLQQLMTYSQKKLTKNSFMRIYMATILEVIVNIKNRFIIIQKIQQQFNKKKLKKEQDTYCKSIFIKISKNRNQFQKLELNIFQEVEDNLQYDKNNIQNNQNKFSNKYIFKQLVYYQFIFITTIFKGKLKRYIEQIGSIQTIGQKNLLQLCENLDQQLTQIQIKYNLHQEYDNYPQNFNQYKFNLQKNKPNYKDIQILNTIFQQNESNDHVYPFSSVTKAEYSKHLNLLSLLVSINKCNIPIATGFIIGDGLICTAMHAIDKKDIIQRKFQPYRILYNKQPYEIQDTYPNTQDQLNIQNQQFDDIIVIKIKDSPITKSITILDFFKNTREFNQRQFVKIFGFGKSKDGKGIVHKKSIGQMIINDKNISKKHHLPLKGETMFSGSPICVWSNTSNSIQTLPLALGLYIGKTNPNQQNFHGRYTKFNSQQKFIPVTNDQQEKQKALKFISKINPQPISQYESFLNDELFIEFVYQNYGILDHFLLRILAEVVKLNHYNFYLKQLKVDNLILNRDDSINILFSDLSLLKVSDAQKQCQQLLKDKWQKRQNMLTIAQQFERMNLQAVLGFLQQISKIWHHKGRQSIILDRAKRLEAETSLNSFFEQIDKDFQIRQWKSKQIFYQQKEHKLEQNQQEENQKISIKKQDKNQKEQNKQTTKQAQIKEEKNILPSKKSQKSKIYILSKRIEQRKEIRSQISKKMDYFDIYQRHFIQKPKYRLEKLLICQQILRNKKYSINYEMKNQFKLVNIKRSFFSRLQYYKNLQLISTYNPQMNHFNLLFKCFNKECQQFIQYKEQPNELKKDQNEFTTMLQKFKETCYNQAIIKDFINNQTKQFHETYHQIKKWKHLQDFLEFKICLKYLEIANMIPKKNIQDDGFQIFAGQNPNDG